MAEPTVYRPEFITRRELPAAVVRAEGLPAEQMIAFLGTALSALRAAADAAAIAPVGPSYARYDSELIGEIDIEAGIPLLAELDAPLEFNGIEIRSGSMPGGPAARAVHIGPHRDLTETWGEFLGVIRAAGHTPHLPYIENYTAAAGSGADREALTTELIAPIAD